LRALLLAAMLPLCRRLCVWLLAAAGALAPAALVGLLLLPRLGCPG
jgi:hypothetical protein